MEREKVYELVQKGYGELARVGGSCCLPSSGCCGRGDVRELSQLVGYTPEELASVPAESNLGLGCGNPVALASLREGEVVLDLGSGPGFDCFLAARRVGEKGMVIGVDMTPEMLERARESAQEGGFKNVEFRWGKIEDLPVEDLSVDVIISNCVINLSPDKQKVFKEAYRVLKKGGRLMVSDIVLTRPLPQAISHSLEAYLGCIAGAILKGEYLEAIGSAGFVDVKILEERPYVADLLFMDPAVKGLLDKLKITREEAEHMASSVFSIKVSAYK